MTGRFEAGRGQRFDSISFGKVVKERYLFHRFVSCTGSDKPGSPNSCLSSDSDNFFLLFPPSSMSFPHPKWTFSNRPRPFLPIDLVHKKFPLSSLPFISARITTCTNRHICLLPSRKYTLIYRLSKRASSFRVSSPYQCPVQFYPIHPPYLFPTLSSSYFFFTSSFPRFTSSFFFFYYFVCHFLLPAPPPLSCHAPPAYRFPSADGGGQGWPPPPPCLAS